MIRRIAPLLLTFLLLSGCAGLGALKEGYEGLMEVFGGSDTVDPPVELEPLEPKLVVRTLWDLDVGKGYDGQYVNLRPGVGAGAVFAADRRGLVEAHDRATGSELWSVELELPLSSGPAVGREVIVLASINGDVVALSQKDGSIVWRATVSSEVLAFPAIARGLVVIRSNDGHINALDEKTGARLWYHERSVPPLAVRSRGAPAITSEFVLDGYASGKLLALQIQDGKQAWESVVAMPRGRSEIERLVDVDSTPILRGDTIYVSGYQGGVAALSVKDGEVMWRRENLSTASGLTADRKSLYLTDGVSDVWRLDVNSGADLWKQTALHQRRLTAPVPVKEYLVVGDLEGYLHFLSKDDGSLVARVQIADKPIDAPPVVVDDVVYAQSADGVVVAIALD